MRRGMGEPFLLVIAYEAGSEMLSGEYLGEVNETKGKYELKGTRFMRKIRWMPLWMSFIIVLGLAAQGYAAASEDSEKNAENREQLDMEFTDTDEAQWAAEAIGILKFKNVLSGYDDGSFRPNKPVTRAEAVVAAVRLMGLEEEAKAKPADLQLYFKDANVIQKQFKWAKGYIAVALEQGLFDTSMDKLNPNQPASRVWIASLLVKALGLEEEALAQMNVLPDFKDADAIAAGAIGYVNVAVEEGIVSGYPDDTFKPNKNVTRAELASLLVRTGEGLLEQSGAGVVTGEIMDIQFDDKSVTEDVYTSVTADVYATATGSITVVTLGGESQTYKISPNLAVPYQDTFIPASQLAVSDTVSLTVQDGVVIEASFIEQESAHEQPAGIYEFKLKIEYDKKQSIEMKYENDREHIKAEIEKKTDGKKEKVKGEEAIQQLESLLESAALTPELTNPEILEQVLKALNMQQPVNGKLEVEIKFANGQKVEIELESEDDEQNGDEEDKAGEGRGNERGKGK
ncbi:S-layer homology domain-containing protein [Marinicrinis lubricantis]|uniref:S-layer homology domain-containing protein n=1 Tax=Marinicrinis lubricantis TaxID=2086470 RepID=A0ABW1IS45_9BACL